MSTSPTLRAREDRRRHCVRLALGMALSFPLNVALRGTVGAGLLLGSVVVRPAGAATPGVTVEFVDPDRFADIGRLRSDRERTLSELRAAFEALAAARLRPGQSLQVQVLNVDLAGFLQPMTRPPGTDVRVRRVGSDPAQIAFRWTLSQDGRSVASGDERLVDVDTATWTERDADSALALERRMLERWFDERIGRPAGAPAGRR